MELNLQETKDILKKWLETCDKPEQVQLMENVADEFIKKRFLHIETPFKISEAYTEIMYAIEDKKEELKRKIWRQEHGEPVILKHPQYP